MGGRGNGFRVSSSLSVFSPSLDSDELESSSCDLGCRLRDVLNSFILYILTSRSSSAIRSSFCRQTVGGGGERSRVERAAVRLLRVGPALAPEAPDWGVTNCSLLWSSPP